MIIEYCEPDGTVLDTVTFAAGSDPVYVTGRARSLVESKTATLGPDRTVQALQSWSNGYVLTREVNATA